MQEHLQALVPASCPGRPAHAVAHGERAHPSHRGPSLACGVSMKAREVMPLMLVFVSICRTCSGADERGAYSADEVLDIDASQTNRPTGCGECGALERGALCMKPSTTQSPLEVGPRIQVEGKAPAVADTSAPAGSWQISYTSSEPARPTSAPCSIRRLAAERWNPDGSLQD